MRSDAPLGFYQSFQFEKVQFPEPKVRRPELPKDSTRNEGESQLPPRGGIALVHRIPPVGLKCVSEKRRREMTALLGGEQGSRRLA
jgi:hypothetical protein